MEMEDTILSTILDNNSMQQILSNLPVKALMKFKCVSKSWESLTDDQSFIKLHQSKSHLQLLIMMYTDCSIKVYTPKDGFQGGGALHKATIPWSGVSILKPINGLFCFVNVIHASCRIYNLGTRHATPWVSTSVPILRRPFVTQTPAFGFGFDPSTGKHKVLCFWDISNYGKVDHICEVLTVGENQWRKIDEVPPVRPTGAIVYANGSLYQRNRDDNFFKSPDIEVILAFDVGTEKFRVIPIPDFVIDSYRTSEDSFQLAQYLLEVDGHIALIDRLSDNVAKLWISDDDYLRQTDVKWVEETIMLPFQWPSGRSIYFHAVQGTKEIICRPLEARDVVTLYIYDRGMKSFRDINIVDLSPSMNPFVYGMFTLYESLLPVQTKEKIED
ncbi:hypothetical protein MKW94_022743 [Papaver nudicaule]|uniref:F-box domain-containing protein n=1 Tax=Papaver nudicaule TaxID=74823 RepID=A0AA41S9L0_PAPNU|nr:hypothetical protein [Papaver nudicaule]